MSIQMKLLVVAACCLFVLPFFAALVFYHVVVEQQFETTNFWSVFFGWQVLFVGIAALVAGYRLIQKKTIRRFAVPLVIIAASLALVIIPSWVSRSTRLYLTGEGGPAGPEMNCLMWEKTGVFSTYDATWDASCGLMSIPSFSKFWIDQRREADQTDASSSYYVTFAVDEYILLTGVVAALWIARKRVQR